jgi:hypothetical protein
METAGQCEISYGIDIGIARFRNTGILVNVDVAATGPSERERRDDRAAGASDDHGSAAGPRHSVAEGRAGTP